MRKGLPWVLGILLIGATALFAQAPPSSLQPQPPPAFPVTGVLPELQPPEFGTPSTLIVETPPPLEYARPFRFWLRAEYLAWWVKNAPLPVSLVTTGDASSNPGAELLNSNLHYGSFAGMRLGIGAWFDDYDNIGLENSYFFLGRRSRNFFVSSDDAGNPTLAYPFSNQTPGAGGAYLLQISSPGQFAGNALISSALQTWGAEVNGAFCLVRTPRLEFTVLAGFRYADLRENLDISNVTSDLTTSPNTVMVFDDNFNTRNQFYGGQIGSRLNWRTPGISLDVTGKVAMGSTHEVVDIQGFSTQFGSKALNGSFPGGFFAQPSNSGRFTSNQFTVVPSLEVKLSLFLRDCFRIFVGYDFMYWSQVVRPGSQIDHNINLSQSVILGNTNGVLTGPASPMPLFNRTDFWAQGLSVGFELRY
jgi:hypothetical protein